MRLSLSRRPEKCRSYLRPCVMNSLLRRRTITPARNESEKKMYTRKNENKRKKLTVSGDMSFQTYFSEEEESNKKSSWS